MCYSPDRIRLFHRNIKRIGMIRPPSREALRSSSRDPFRTGRNWTKADLFLCEQDGRRLVIKDYAPRPFWVRNTIGRFLVGRECAAYTRLSGIAGIPPLAGRIDSHAFAVGWVEGKELSSFRRGEVPASFFDRLLELLLAIHRAGVAHGDLHHRDILVDSLGSPALVDFSTAVLLEPGAGGIRCRVFEAACTSDRRAALKHKRRHAPQALSEEENHDLDHPPVWYRFGKGLRHLLGRGEPR